MDNLPDAVRVWLENVAAGDIVVVYQVSLCQDLLIPASKVKAFIDFDDVHVMPFILRLDYPEDISWASSSGLPPHSIGVREGDFRSFQPSEYGEILGAFEESDKLRGEQDHRRDERIQETVIHCESGCLAISCELV